MAIGAKKFSRNEFFAKWVHHVIQSSQHNMHRNAKRLTPRQTFQPKAELTIAQLWGHSPLHRSWMDQMTLKDLFKNGRNFFETSTLGAKTKLFCLLWNKIRPLIFFFEEIATFLTEHDTRTGCQKYQEGFSDKLKFLKFLPSLCSSPQTAQIGLHF